MRFRRVNSVILLFECVCACMCNSSIFFLFSPFIKIYNSCWLSVEMNVVNNSSKDWLSSGNMQRIDLMIARILHTFSYCLDKRMFLLFNVQQKGVYTITYDLLKGWRKKKLWLKSDLVTSSGNNGLLTSYSINATQLSTENEITMEL